jgi:hypothetical protein
MWKELGEFDTKVVEEFVELTEQQDAVRSYIRRAEELKDRVDRLVYEKVRGDYESRLDALDKRALPLRTEVRKQYAKLCSLHKQLTASCDKARLEKEELEFRHSVGELEDKDRTGRLPEIEENLNRFRSQLSDVEELRSRFAEAGAAVEDLEPARDEISDADASVETTRLDAGKIRRAATGPSAASPAKTVILPEDAVESYVSEGGGEASTDDTVVLPRAVLIREPGSSNEEHRLTTFNYVGRGEDNHVCVKAPSVSRRHALITATPTGFSLKDLESRGGTFVNGKRITECILTDGDQIKMGEVQLVFRLSKA